MNHKEKNSNQKPLAPSGLGLGLASLWGAWLLWLEGDPGLIQMLLSGSLLQSYWTEYYEVVTCVYVLIAAVCSSQESWLASLSVSCQHVSSSLPFLPGTVGLGFKGLK